MLWHFMFLHEPEDQICSWVRNYCQNYCIFEGRVEFYELKSDTPGHPNVDKQEQTIY